MRGRLGGRGLPGWRGFPAEEGPLGRRGHLEDEGLPGATANRVCLCDSQYLRERVKEISNHFQGGLSPGLMFITRVRTSEGLVSNFKIDQ